MIIIFMKRVPAFAAIAVGTLLLAGCSGSAEGSGVEVVASAYPFAYVAQEVGGDKISVDNLTSPGVEPHDIELTPRQVADLSDADLVVVEHGFQPAVDNAVEQQEITGEQLLDVAEVAHLQHTGAAEAEHAGEDDHAEEEAELDPHIWLDPTNMVAITSAVADRLSELDPDNASGYQDNADRLTAELRELDRDFSEGLANCARRTVVTSHDAFRYLAMRYDLEMVPIAGLEPTQEPSPAQQAEITEAVRAEGVTTIFTEELVSPAVAESIADETGATIATLDPIEGLSEATSDEDYLSLMRANLAALQDANGC